MKWKLFSWDWKAQPDIQAICDYIADNPGSCWISIETHSDDYAGVVCPVGTTPERAEKEYRNWMNDEPSVEWDEE